LFTDISLTHCTVYCCLLAHATGRDTTTSYNSSGYSSDSSDSSDGGANSASGVCEYIDVRKPLTFVDWQIQNSGFVARRPVVNAKAEPVKSTTYATVAAAEAAARDSDLRVHAHKKWGQKAVAVRTTERRAAMSRAAAAAELEGTRKRSHDQMCAAEFDLSMFDDDMIIEPDAVLDADMTCEELELIAGMQFSADEQ
jgi:hypothetical protein